jgi:hypothetical protein
MGFSKFNRVVTDSRTTGCIEQHLNGNGNACWSAAPSTMLKTAQIFQALWFVVKAILQLMT